MRRAAWLFAGAILGLGCAARARHDMGAPATPPAATPAPASPTNAPGGGEAAPKADRKPSSTTFAEPPPGQAGDVDKDEAQAIVAFYLSEKAVFASLGSCGLACKALASMERAARTLCDGARDDADRSRCDDGKARLRSARARVREACGACKDGPTTDPDAP